MDSNPNSKDVDASLDHVLTTPGSTRLSQKINLKKGLRMYIAGCPRQAFWAFSLVLDEDPANVVAHYLCGLALQSLNLPGEARTEWHLATVLVSNQGQSISAEWAKQMARNLLEADQARAM